MQNVFWSYVCVFYLIMCTHVHAQTIEWSNQQKVKSKSIFSRVLGQNGSGIFIVKSRSSSFEKELTIEKYKPNLALDWEKSIWQQPGSRLEKIIVQPDGLLCIASQKTATHYELIFWLHNNDLGITASPVVLIQEQLSAFSGVPEYFISKAQTHDEGWNIVYLTQDATRKGLLNVAAFSKNMQFAYKKQYISDRLASDIVITDVQSDIKNNVFVLADWPKTETVSKKNIARTFNLLAYYSESGQFELYPSHTDSILIEDWGMCVNPVSETVSIAGIYRTVGATKSTGTFFQSIDIALRQQHVLKLTPFENQFITRLNTASLSNTGEGVSDIYVRKVIPRSDGGCMLVGERYYETRQSYTYYVNGYPQTSFRVVYNYDEIVYVNIKPDGTIQQQDFIKKKQSSMGDGLYFSSFITVNTEDRLSFIYNADVNVEGDVYITSISPSGEIDTRIFIKSLSFYISVLPEEYKQIAQNIVLCSTLKDRKYALMRVTF